MTSFGRKTHSERRLIVGCVLTHLYRSCFVLFQSMVDGLSRFFKQLFIPVLIKKRTPLCTNQVSINGKLSFH
jgi:hypothetical protein